MPQDLLDSDTPDTVRMPVKDARDLGERALRKVGYTQNDAAVVVDQLIDAAHRETPIVLVDVHAEATSEKVAMGWHLAGRATAVVGTHTHVQTSDARVLPGGTADGISSRHC